MYVVDSARLGMAHLVKLKTALLGVDGDFPGVECLLQPK